MVEFRGRRQRAEQGLGPLGELARRAAVGDGVRLARLHRGHHDRPGRVRVHAQIAQEAGLVPLTPVVALPFPGGGLGAGSREVAGRAGGGGQVRRHHSRAEDRDADGVALQGELLAQGLGESDHRGLRRLVDGRAARGGEADRGSGVDHVARLAARDHARQERLNPVDHSADVDADVEVPQFVGHLVDRQRPADSGVVDEQRHRADAFLRRVRDAGERRTVAHVEVEGRHGGERGQFGFCLVQCLLVDVGDREPDALPGEGAGDAQADSLGGAGDERGAPG